MSQSKQSFEKDLGELLKKYDAYIFSIDYGGILEDGVLMVGVKRLEPTEINETT